MPKESNGEVRGRARIDTIVLCFTAWLLFHPVASAQIAFWPTSVAPAPIPPGAGGTLPGQAGSGSSLLTSSLGSDSCATPDFINGTGVFAFDNTNATTGPEAQTFAGCSDLGAGGIAQDVWFVWTAPINGEVELSTCGLTALDTKVGVWNYAVIGQACPGLLQSGLFGCNDDFSPSVRQSKFMFQVIAGAQYMLHIGCFPGNQFSPPSPGGVGAFSLEYWPRPDPTPCSVDDGEADISAVVGQSGQGTCMLMRYGMPGARTNVSGIEVVWGAQLNAANSTLIDGMPATVALWDDPTDDGDPRDCVLIEQVATTIQNHDTDIFNFVPLTTAHLLDGYYYIGATYTNPTLMPPNHNPYQLDWDNLESYPAGPGAPFEKFAVWLGVRTSGGEVDTSNLSGTGPNPVVRVQAAVVRQGVLVYARNSAQLIRPTCSPLIGQPGLAFCTNGTTGVDHSSQCPCGNAGASSRGCANSLDPDGAYLTAYGETTDDTFPMPGPSPVKLYCLGLPSTAFTLFLQHDSLGDSVFHDGVLCASGTLVRLRGRGAGASQSRPAGVAEFPNSSFAMDASLTLSFRGGVVPGSGVVRYYSAWYRNAAPSFCPPATANVSNGWVVTW